MSSIFFQLDEAQVVLAAHGGESVGPSLGAVEGLDGDDGFPVVGETGAYLLDVVKGKHDDAASVAPDCEQF